jgi:hypothetical protein
VKALRAFGALYNNKKAARLGQKSSLTIYAKNSEDDAIQGDRWSNLHWSIQHYHL